MVPMNMASIMTFLKAATLMRTFEGSFVVMAHISIIGCIHVNFKISVDVGNINLVTYIG